MSQIESWSNEEVITWIQKEYANKPKRQQLLVSSIKDNEYNGKELLLCEDIDELMDALEITKRIIAKDLFERIKKVKEQAIAEIVDNASKIDDEENKLKTSADLDYLLKIFEGLFPIKRENEIKEEEIDENDSMKEFLSMVKQIARSTKDFVKSLISINFKRSLTDEIIDICFKYYELLDLTLKRFCAYGGDIKQLSQCMTEISNIFLLPSVIKKNLDNLDSKSQKKVIEKLRETTCNGLKKSTKQFTEKLADIEKIHVKNLDKLSKQWFQLNRRIMKLLTVIQEDKKAKQQKMYKKPQNHHEANVSTTLDKLSATAKYIGGFCLKWIAAPLTFGVACCLGAVSGAAVGAGVVLCATGAGAIPGAGLIAGGLAVGGALVYKIDDVMNCMINKGNQLMRDGKYELEEMKEIEATQQNIKQIEMMQSSLERMAQVSQHFGNIINLEIINFNKIKQHNPQNVIQCDELMEAEALLMDQTILNKIKRLGEAILNCTKYLDKSKKNIEMVEKTCEQEMNSFFEHVQRPLMDMIDGNSNKTDNKQ